MLYYVDEEMIDEEMSFEAAAARFDEEMRACDELEAELWEVRCQCQGAFT